MLPQRSDPADYLARPDSNLDAFTSTAGLPLITVHVENAIARQGDAMQWPEGRLQALRAVAGYLSTYPSEYVAQQAGWLSEALGVQTSTVTREPVEAFARTDLRDTHRAQSVDI